MRDSPPEHLLHIKPPSRARRIATAFALVVLPACVPFLVLWLAEPVDKQLVTPGVVRPVEVRLDGKRVTAGDIRLVTADIVRRPSRLRYWLERRHPWVETHGPQEILALAGRALLPQPELGNDLAARTVSLAASQPVGPGPLAGKPPSGREQLRESKATAAYVALTMTHHSAQFTGGGVQVLSMPAGGSVLPGDTIVAAGGQPIRTWLDLRAATRNRPPGSKLPVRMTRGPGQFTVSAYDGGISFRGLTVDAEVRGDIDITFASRGAVGDSAGLAYTLAAVSALRGVDLATGRRVVATGAVLPDGQVRAVGFVAQKGRAAERSHADVFMVPPGSGKAARTFAPTLKVVEVASVQQAIDWLRKHPGRSA